jgi:nucleoside-diphosphate-sugar epimerase
MKNKISPQLPDAIATESDLDDLLTHPGEALVEFIQTVSSPLLILGAGGKMGPTLSVLAKRAAQQACHPLEVVAVSRFGDASTRSWLEARGVDTISCDLLEPSAYNLLPDAENIIYLVGMKFGTNQNPARTWAYNTLIPANTARRYAKSRIVALSSGNVYSLVPVDSPGVDETFPLTPLGEYANSCVARERIFEHFSAQNGTPIALIRLNYALDLRYGVFRDLAETIWRQDPVDLCMGYVNCIWQGDANEMILRALGLAASPAEAFNLTGVEKLSIRALALRLGALMGKPVTFTGSEEPTALLSNPAKLLAVLGAPLTPLDAVLRWTAAWVMAGGRSLGKPTHFAVRTGEY